MEAQNVTTEVEHTVRNSINKKRRGGRPCLTAAERRCYKIKTGFTPAEYEKLAARAETANISEPEFIRRICINQPIYTVPAINSQALIELNKIGTNLNQIAKIANTSQSFDAVAELQKLNQELQKIGKQIVSLS